MSLTLIELGELKQQGALAVIKKCQEWGLIPQEGEYMCPLCGSPLKLGVSSNSVDGYHWLCEHMVKNSSRKRVRCRKRISVRLNTFFEESKLSIIQIVGFMSMWVESFSIETITRQIKISRQTALDWSSFCSEVVCNAMMEKNQEPIGCDADLARSILREEGIAIEEDRILVFYRLAGQLYNPLQPKESLKEIIRRPTSENKTHRREKEKNKRLLLE